MSIHETEHALAGVTVKLRDGVQDPVQEAVVAGATFKIDDYWDRVSGGSWMYQSGNFAAMNYGLRAGKLGLPFDDNVVYGEINGLGHIVHVSELGDVVE